MRFEGRWRRLGATVAIAVALSGWWTIASAQAVEEPISGASIPKYVQPLVIPPAMPRTGTLSGKGEPIDYYEIAVRQFQQQILPPGFPATTVWSYGSVNHPGTFNYPAFTIEARVGRPVRVKWINQLVDGDGNFLPHLLPVDATLHWANPPGGLDGRDSRPTPTATPGPYRGPVPIVTHLHGGLSTQESDGFAEAWYLPAARNIPAGHATEGTWYAFMENEFRKKFGFGWQPGTATFQYENDQPPATIWYHDHTLGMTRVNVYAGPAGFYLLRGACRGRDDDGDDDPHHGRDDGQDDGSHDTKRMDGSTRKDGADGKGREDRCKDDERTAKVEKQLAEFNDPGPTGRVFEIPLAIQDRSFKADGSLFYPSSRAFFDGFAGPFIPASDVPPIWNPEFFGNTMVVNGRTWPVLQIEPRRYRLRFLNGSNSRFLVLKWATDPEARPAQAALPFWQIGGDGGFLPAPVRLDQLLMGNAERADTIVDFTGLTPGTVIYLVNEGPDEPFGGFPVTPADPATTGQVMRLEVVPLQGKDKTPLPQELKLPKPARLGPAQLVRKVSLNELISPVANGPVAALLGTVNPTTGEGEPKLWDDPITENPRLHATEIWEIHNFTVDAHPIHLHELHFEVVNRQPMVVGAPRPPEPWETGLKDTVIAYPGEITRVKARFDEPGLFVWHCHIVEHEDNEMMRPLFVGPNPPDLDAPPGSRPKPKPRLSKNE